MTFGGWIVTFLVSLVALLTALAMVDMMHLTKPGGRMERWSEGFEIVVMAAAAGTLLAAFVMMAVLAMGGPG